MIPQQFRFCYTIKGMVELLLLLRIIPAKMGDGSEMVRGLKLFFEILFVFETVV